MSTEATNTEQANEPWRLNFGAQPIADGGILFRVWAPLAHSVAVRILGQPIRRIEMNSTGEGVFEVVAPEVDAGADYKYVIDNDRERPDPVSRWQPEGVHGPSRVVDPERFVWTDQGWEGIPLKDFLIYELHIGTFTPEGTFDSAISKLPFLKELGITAVEIMPVAEFPGGRNWGYDGAHIYAPQSTYGGPDGLKRLVDACHREGLAVVLDVVYNHLGPEGNYLGDYVPIFSRNYRTPWGSALNFDNQESDGIRRYFIDNALYWLTEFHIDALRLDATDRIIDISPHHILEEIATAFREQSRRLGCLAFTIGESDLNDVRVIKPSAECGYGLDAQWSDDFHHSLHPLITGAERGYFADFGQMSDLAKAIQEGFVYDGRRSIFRSKRHGTSSIDRPGEQFVICIQNHDQIANAYWGDRLGTLLSVEQQKLVAALLLCAPNLPLIFMGQEWGETAPFQFFTSHTDPGLAKAVYEGRKKEYSSFVKEEGSTGVGDFADPQAPGTFERSKLTWSQTNESPHSEILRFYRDMIALRKEHSGLSNCDKGLTSVEYDDEARWISVQRGDRSGSRALLVCNLASEERKITPSFVMNANWDLALFTGDKKYGGRDGIMPSVHLESGQGITLPGWSAAVYLISDVGSHKGAENQ
jgi:maltooligosyltrehalose trehalohydrolase